MFRLPELQGSKTRLTNMIGTRGNLASAFVQVLGFSDIEMSPSLVPNVILMFKVKYLSTDGGINLHSQTYGFVIAV